MSLARIGRYELLEPLGQGGMAEVFLARPVGEQRGLVFALKSVLSQHASDHKFVEMFHRELEIATTLCHPNLVAVVDHGQDAGRDFMVMEYVHGADLGDLLNLAGGRDLRVPLPVALKIVVASARGLHYLHECPSREGGAPEIVHRDVSPSNVLVGYDGTVKVTDFGIATATAHTRTTEAGTVKGKMGYLSPEQCRSETLDRRSDVFALGVLLYETTLGERLYLGDNDYAVMHQIISGDFDAPSSRDPEYPTDLEDIVLRALAPEREDRFATAAEMADSLEAFASTNGLELYPAAVSEWVHMLVPGQPYPSFPASLWGGGTAVVRGTASAARPARTAAIIGGAMLVAVLGVTAAVFAASPGGEPEVSGPGPRAPAVEPPAGGVAPPASSPGGDQSAASEDHGGVANVEVESKFSTETGDDVMMVEDDDPAARTRRGRRRSRPRGKKSQNGAGPRYDLDAPRPPR